jgi:rod shape-determining protein MreD
VPGKPLIFATLLVALLLSILPVPQWAVWIKPLWLPLVIVFWIAAYEAVGLFLAWILGFSLDILTGTLVGEHALAITIIAFLAAKSHRRFKVIPIWHQCWYVFFYLIIYQFVFFVVQGMIGYPIKEWKFWIAPFVSVLLWPWLNALLHRSQKHYAI